jgi:hypothetical protein
MAVSRRTCCRMCGTELRLPLWKALIGLTIGTCDDEPTCQGFRAGRARVAHPVRQDRLAS